MGISIVKKWQVYAVSHKIDKITRKIFNSISKQKDQHLEHGNVRKSGDWGIIKDNTVVWVILADIILGKPIQYSITYSLPDKKYSCHAMTERNNFSSVFQFSTADIEVLEDRLRELANHIPSLRERLLREYLFSEAKNAPGRGWLKIFFGKAKIEEHLNTKIDNLYQQGRISGGERDRLGNYISNLV